MHNDTFLFIRSTVCTRIVRKLTLIDFRLFLNFSFINYSQHEIAKKKKRTYIQYLEIAKLSISDTIIARK